MSQFPAALRNSRVTLLEAKMFSLLRKMLAVITLIAGGLAHAQSYDQAIGAFDQFFANNSAFGWACLPGDPTTKVWVQLGVHSNYGSPITWITSAPADKQRNDIGRSGQCGPSDNEESYYHGFEWPVIMSEYLEKNKVHGLYAWVWTSTYPYYQFISGAGSIYTYESGLPTSQIWRTDYDNPHLRQPALLSCIWPFHGANNRQIAPGMPPTNPFTRQTVPGGATPGGVNGALVPGPYGLLGFDTPNIYCINYPASTFVPQPWTASNSAAGGPTGLIWPNASNGNPWWPTYNYWVVHANVEKSYQLSNVPTNPPGHGKEASSGPPSQSEPVTGGLFSVGSDAGAFTLTIDNTSPLVKGKLPFLSIGAHNGRGTSGPIAYVAPTGLETFVEFDITYLETHYVTSANIPTILGGDVNRQTDYQLIDFFVEGIFAGTKKMIWVSLGLEQRNGRANWNWNAAHSFFYPGGDLNLFSAAEALACANSQSAPSAKIPKLAEFPIGTTHSVSIPLRALFKCVDLKPWDDFRNWGYSPLMYGRELVISGVHVGIETGSGNVGRHSVKITTPRLVKR